VLCNGVLVLTRNLSGRNCQSV